MLQKPESIGPLVLRAENVLRNARHAGLPLWDRAVIGLLEPLHYAYGALEARLSGKKTVSLLLLSQGDMKGIGDERQYEPLLRHRASLRRSFGIRVRRMRLGNSEAAERTLARRLPHYDVVGLKFSSFLPSVDAARIVKSTRFAMRDDAKLVFFDGDDDLGVARPELMDHYDLYVKRHCLRDRTRYLDGGIGKSNLTDFVARQYGFSFRGDPFPVSLPVLAGQLDKIVAGWSFGLDNKIQRYARRCAAGKRPVHKTIDVICRATLGTDADWRYYLREPVRTVLDDLREDYIVRTPSTNISQRAYRKEMLASRICVSPFGYGEICYRDFEAILSGCVLVKPDMSHVESCPDIFIPGVTYMPVMWDYSDLADVIRELLADPERCENLRFNAHARLERALSAPAVAERIRTVLAPVLKIR